MENKGKDGKVIIKILACCFFSALFFLFGFFALNKTDSLNPRTQVVPCAQILNCNFVKYESGDKRLNAILNFVNYEGDTKHFFTAEEIASKVNEFQTDLAEYFYYVSSGYLTVNFDYIVSIAPNSYEFYTSKTEGDCNCELEIFENALEKCTDEKGNKKQIAFSDYQVKINLFAGDTGAWNSFTWPHAFEEYGLVLLTENKCDIGTTAHEIIHIASLPDLYSYMGDNVNFAVGPLDIMGNAEGGSSLNAYYKNKVGWISSSNCGDDKITEIEELNTADMQGGNLILAPSFYHGDEVKTIAYKFGENALRHEFFMVEYRIKNYDGKFDKGLTSDRAIVVYRVNTTAYGNVYAGANEGNAEIVFMGNLSKDVASYDYFSSCELVEGSYGSIEKSSHAFVYSSSEGKKNLFNGQILKFRLNIKSLSDVAIISFDELKYCAITPKVSGEGGELSINRTTSVCNFTNFTVRFLPIGNNSVTAIKIDGKALSFDEVLNWSAKGYYTFENVDKDHTVEVGFGEIKCGLKFELDGGTFTQAVDEFYYFGKQTLLPTPFKQGYKFLGYTFEENGTSYITKIPKSAYGDKTLYAHWKLITFYVTASSFGEGKLSSEGVLTIPVNEDLTLSLCPDEGKNLTSLKIDGQEISLDELITLIEKGSYTFYNIVENRTIEAFFGELTFNLKLNLDGGELNEEVYRYTYGKDFSLPIPTKKGYNFLGWCKGEEEQEYFSVLSKGTKGDMELCARWSPENSESEKNDLLPYIIGAAAICVVVASCILLLNKKKSNYKRD